MFSPDPEDKRTMSLAGLAATLLIIVMSLFIVRKLQVRALMEDCIMSGRPGCVHRINRLRVSHFLAGGM